MHHCCSVSTRPIVARESFSSRSAVLTLDLTVAPVWSITATMPASFVIHFGTAQASATLGVSAHDGDTSVASSTASAIMEAFISDQDNTQTVTPAFVASLPRGIYDFTGTVGTSYGSLQSSVMTINVLAIPHYG